MDQGGMEKRAHQWVPEERKGCASVRAQNCGIQREMEDTFYPLHTTTQHFVGPLNPVPGKDSFAFSKASNPVT